MRHAWIGFLVCASISPFVNWFVNQGKISNWWTLVPSAGLAVFWSLTAKIHKGSMANIGLLFDIFATTMWVLIFSWSGDKVTPGTYAGLVFLILGLLSVRYF